MTLKEMRAKKLALSEKMSGIVSSVQTEKRAMTKDEIKSFDGAEAELQTVEREIRSMEMAAGAVASTPHIAEGDATAEFRHFLRTSERRAAATGQSNNTGADGKFTNPNAFSNELFKEITGNDGILSVVRPMSVSSDILDFPTVDDTATGLTKDLKQGKELDPVASRKLTIKNVSIPLKTYAIEAVISNQLRDDNAVNLESVITELGAAGISRNASKDVFAVIDAGITISDSGAAGVVDYADLVTTLGGVNGAYYAKGKWVMSQANFIAILALVDANKRPLIQMPIEQGVRPTLFGKPVVVDDNAGVNIYFGDFSTVILAQNTNTNTLVDIYSLSSDLATKYVTSARMGAGVLSATAVVGLKPKK